MSAAVLSPEIRDTFYCRFSVIFPAIQQSVRKREQCLQVSFVFLMFVYYYNLFLLLLIPPSIAV